MCYPGFLWMGFYFFLLGAGSDFLKISNKLLYSHSTFLISRSEYFSSLCNEGIVKIDLHYVLIKMMASYMSARSYEGRILGEL